MPGPRDRSPQGTWPAGDHQVAVESGVGLGLEVNGSWAGGLVKRSKADDLGRVRLERRLSGLRAASRSGGGQKNASNASVAAAPPSRRVLGGRELVSSRKLGASRASHCEEAEAESDSDEQREKVAHACSSKTDKVVDRYRTFLRAVLLCSSRCA